MRRKDREITDQVEIEKMISRAEVCFLGMSINDQPYVIPVNFGFENNTLYIHCANEGKKIDIIKQNPQVSIAFSIDSKLILDGPPQTWTSHFKSVIAFGKAEIVTDLAEKQIGMQILLKHYSEQEVKLNEDDLERVGMIKVKISSMTGKRNLPEGEN